MRNIELEVCLAHVHGVDIDDARIVVSDHLAPRETLACMKTRAFHIRSSERIELLIADARVYIVLITVDMNLPETNEKSS